MCYELVMQPLQPIMFIQRQNNSTTILPHEAKQALRYIKQNLEATCLFLYVTVEFAILRSQGGVGVEYFYDFRRRSGCGAKLFGGGADAEQNFLEEERMRSQKNETPSISAVIVCVMWDRDDHYPVCWLDIRQDSEFASGYGYPNTALKLEPDADKDIQNSLLDISRIQNLGKSGTLHNHLFGIFGRISSAFCSMPPSLSVVWSH